MKNLCLFLFLIPVWLIAETDRNDLLENFTLGDPQIQSISSLAFGPEGILFVGDSKKASIFAINTKDIAATDQVESIQLDRVDVQLAAMLGQSAGDIDIRDMAVNPLSKSVYLALQGLDGTPVLLKLQNGKFSFVPLNNLEYAKMDLAKAVSEDTKDRRGRSMREWSISDLAYHKGRVLVSGLSNEEFSSTFRSIPFPFNQGQSMSSLEIYHAAHGQYETYAPIKTFLPVALNGEDHLIASYTCTPLVIFPFKELSDGKHVKGRTVAELGNRNTPLDIVTYRKDDKDYILMSNTSRALMKIDPGNIESFSNFLTTPVEENSATAGVKFIALPYVNVRQMDRLSDDRIVLLQRMSNGDLNLHTVESSRL